jgi:hypothetical protein
VSPVVFGVLSEPNRNGDQVSRRSDSGIQYWLLNTSLFSVGAAIGIREVRRIRLRFDPKIAPLPSRP